MIKKKMKKIKKNTYLKQNIYKQKKILNIQNKINREFKK